MINFNIIPSIVSRLLEFLQCLFLNNISLSFQFFNRILYFFSLLFYFVCNLFKFGFKLFIHFKLSCQLLFHRLITLFLFLHFVAFQFCLAHCLIDVDFERCLTVVTLLVRHCQLGTLFIHFFYSLFLFFYLLFVIFTFLQIFRDLLKKILVLIIKFSKLLSF